MMRCCLSFLYVILPLLLLSQSSKNLELIANISGEESATDIWGFQHSNGTEYAIMGDQNSTRIYSLADPANPEKVADINGAPSFWRDIKNFNDVVYVVAQEGNDGLLVIDMSMIDQDSLSHSFLNLDVIVRSASYGRLAGCHNLYIDENGYLYLAGCNTGLGGVVILDLNENPLLPKVVGIQNWDYAHDVFVRDNLMYTSDIYSGTMSIYNVENKSRPILLGTIRTPDSFTHNVWSNEDNQVAFTTDERDGASVAAYDVSDPTNIRFIDKFKTVDSDIPIPHNVHFHEDYLYTSWYTEGVIITDVSRPDNMIEVGHYDTWDGPDGDFNGCWGAYPFLPSGLLLASDRKTGLYVLQPTLIRACYLEGLITDFDTGLPVNGANIKILSDDKNHKSSKPDGTYKTGQATPGEFSVTISHPDYLTVETSTTLSSGEVTDLDVQLTKRKLYSFQANTGIENGEPLSNANITLTNEFHTYELMSEQDGFAVGDILEGEYQLYAGKWGYKQVDYGTVNIEDANDVNIVLEPGYEDDFIFDFGWQVRSNHFAGKWKRVVPKATTFAGKKSNVNFDIPDDLGQSCYVTGNGSGDPDADDVDNGATGMTSGWIDLSEIKKPHLEYYKWFYNDGGINEPDDYLKTYIVTNAGTTEIESVEIKRKSGEWTHSSIDIREFVNDDMIKILFEAADIGADHIVEAGIDVFRISEGTTISTNEIEVVNQFKLFPNPVDDQLTLQSKVYLGKADIRIFDTKGRLVHKTLITSKEKTLNLNNLQSGTYFLNVAGEDFKQTIKLVKS